MHNSICDVHGIKIGNAQDFQAVTGCTVILCETDAFAGCDIRGGAPGTRETDCLKPFHLVEKVQAILLTGGSAFGLESASGVMKYLEEKNRGFFVGKTYVPIVPAAVIFDFNIGDYKIRPDKEMGYQACLNATTSFETGSVGAGCGATVGKILGIENAMKSGIGTASLKEDELIIGALVVVNAFGDVYDEQTNKIIAGARDDEAKKFADTSELLKKGIGRKSFGENTTLAVVATNALLNKEQINKVAHMAHDGIARAIKPCHTMFDGDTVFALSIGDVKTDVSRVGHIASEVVKSAIVNAIKSSKSLGGIPSSQEINYAYL